MSIIPPKPFLDEKLPGIAGLDQRSRDIFRRLVDTYLETGEPVGSRTISRILPHSLSPASVRNVMMDLEDAGLIFSPHTSAGRVPTDLGLRFFVDALMEVGSMSADERARIDAQIAASNRPAAHRRRAGRGHDAAVRSFTLRRRDRHAQDQCTAEAHRIRQSRRRAAPW